MSIEKKEGDTYEYGAYCNRTQTYKYSYENSQSLEYFCIFLYFLLLGIPRCTFFKTFVYLSIFLVLPIRQFFDLVRLCD